MHHNRQRSCTDIFPTQGEFAARHAIGQFAAATARATLLLAMANTPARTLLCEGLSQAGYDVHFVQTESDLFAALAQDAADLVLVHTELPDANAFHLCTKLRALSAIPIVLVADQKCYSDMIHGLALGADEYVALPMTLAELDARLNATLRRASYGNYAYRSIGSPSASIRLNEIKRSARVHDQEIPLTQIEFRMVSHLLHHANRPVAKDQLIKAVWGFAEAQEFNFIEVAIRRLRRKIEIDPSKPEYLITVRGMGYQLNVS